MVLLPFCRCSPYVVCTWRVRSRTTTACTRRSRSTEAPHGGAWRDQRASPARTNQWSVFRPSAAKPGRPYGVTYVSSSWRTPSPPRPSASTREADQPRGWRSGPEPDHVISLYAESVFLVSFALFPRNTKRCSCVCAHIEPSTLDSRTRKVGAFLRETQAQMLFTSLVSKKTNVLRCICKKNPLTQQVKISISFILAGVPLADTRCIQLSQRYPSSETAKHAERTWSHSGARYVC